MINYLRKLFGYGGSSDDLVAKGWSEDWLKVREKNFLSQGRNNLVEPMRQSYLVYTCVNLISDTAPKAPLNFYRGFDEIENNHPLRKLFLRPNDHQSYFELISITSMFYSLYGEVFWYINQSVAQRMGTSTIPAEILVIDPRGMKEVIDENTKALKGWLFNNKIAISKDEVIHFKSNNPYNPYRGLSPLDAVEFELRSDYRASEFQEKFFENGAVPGFVLTTDKEDRTPDTELKKISKMWDTQYKGVSKSHKTAVLRGGMDFKVVGLNHQEMSFIDSRVMTRDIICETFRVPKTIFGATEELNRATAEVQEKIFWQTAIQPLLLRIQYKLNTDLINKIDPGIQAKFDFTKIQALQNIYKEDVEAAWFLFQMGYSRNEINARFDLGFKEDTEYGDRKRFPMNLMNVEDEGKEYEDSKSVIGLSYEEEVVEKDNKDIREDRIHLMFKRQHGIFERKLQKKLEDYFFNQMQQILKRIKREKSLESNDIINELDIWDEENKILIRNITPYYKEIIEAGQMIALGNMGITDRTVQLNTNVLYEKINKITGINKTIWNQLKMVIFEGVDNGETIDQITDRIRDTYKVAKKRAKLIARTEVTQAMNEAALLEYKDNGVKQVKWLAAMDERTRATHKDNHGVVRDSGTPFPSGEVYPGQHSPNCRCTLSPYIDNIS